MQKEGYDYDYVFDWTIVDKIEKTPVGGNTIERNPQKYQPSMMVEGQSQGRQGPRKSESEDSESVDNDGKPGQQ